MLAGLAVRLGPGRERLGVDGDQRGDERLAVADDHALADQGVGADPVLEHGGGDVLAAGGHQDLLLAAGDPDEALVVDLADVAGVEPAVARRAPRAVAASSPQ